MPPKPRQLTLNTPLFSFPVPIPNQPTESPCIVVDCRRPYLEFNLSYDCADPLVVLTLHMMLLLFCLWPDWQAAVCSFWWPHGHG